MKEAYFIRHGNADYYRDSMTSIGVRQVERLLGILEPRMPENLSCILVASRSGRTTETAEPISLVLTRKAGKEIKIIEEPCLDQLASMGSDNTILENGKYNVGLIDKYSSLDYGFFVSHDKIITATCIAIAEKYKIILPEFLKIKEYDESLVNLAITEFNLTKQEAIKKVKEYSVFIPELPFIAEASSVHIDFQEKKMEYILNQ
jgi:hypothetical protein